MALTARPGTVMMLAVLTASLLGAAHGRLFDTARATSPASPAEGEVESADDAVYRLPDGFLLGAGSSNYQCEGAWNEDGKGESHLDRHYHRDRPGLENGDEAARSYYLYKDDVRMLHLMKSNAYRFSLSWSRLLPTGDPDNPNPKGVEYYNNLLDELARHNITPVVTLYHLEHPQVFEDGFDGWLSSEMVDHFERYADFAFRTFGDKVQWWTTINEPHIYATLAYGYGVFAPGKKSPGRDEYLSGHHMVLAHARAYRLYYQRHARPGGRVGISYESYFARPRTRAYADVLAAERRNVFELGWTLEPLVTGDYPPEMRRLVDAKSREEGLAQSRLPAFTDDQKRQLKGAIDFIGLNGYYGVEATDGALESSGDPSLDRDSGAIGVHPDDFNEKPIMPVGFYAHSTPWAIRESLLWLKNRYGDIPVMITENGIGKENEEGLDDPHRQQYLTSYLRQVLYALHVDKCNVIGYIYWSLLDSFEWESYSKKFGLIHVDYSSANRTRSLKASAQLFRRIAEERAVPRLAPNAAGAAAAARPAAGLVAVLVTLVVTLLPKKSSVTP